MENVDSVEKAIRRICDEWPSEPCWIFTSPDGNKVYRQMRRDVCPDIFKNDKGEPNKQLYTCLLYTSPSPRDLSTSRMPSSA